MLLSSCRIFSSRFCSHTVQFPGLLQQCKSSAFKIKSCVPRSFRKPLTTQSPGIIVDPLTAGISDKARRIVGRWLLGMAGMTFGAVILGGVTRLTESGLSMVHWHPVKESPPTSAAEWDEEFKQYQQYPEYKHVVAERGEMTLSQFKFIWYMEYMHRMWGRTLGLMYALPAGYFLYRGYFSAKMKPRVLAYGLLIGFQGLLGWYMVRSGLEEKKNDNGPEVPRVSQYRLAAHLGSAFVLYTLFLWSGLSHVLQPIKLQDFAKLKMIRGLSHGVKAMVFTTALSGAFVAGLDAGLVYNSWPKMADRWIPEDIFAMSPRWRNFFDNASTVQFVHRYLGEVTALAAVGLWMVCRGQPLSSRARNAVNSLLAMTAVQVSLGIATLLTYVPVSLAACHQSGSLILLSTAIWLTHSLRRLPK